MAKGDPSGTKRKAQSFTAKDLDLLRESLKIPHESRTLVFEYLAHTHPEHSTKSWHSFYHKKTAILGPEAAAPNPPPDAFSGDEEEGLIRFIASGGSFMVDTSPLLFNQPFLRSEASWAKYYHGDKARIDLIVQKRRVDAAQAAHAQASADGTAPPPQGPYIDAALWSSSSEQQPASGSGSMGVDPSVARYLPNHTLVRPVPPPVMTQAPGVGEEVQGEMYDVGQVQGMMGVPDSPPTQYGDAQEIELHHGPGVDGRESGSPPLEQLSPETDWHAQQHHQQQQAQQHFQSRAPPHAGEVFDQYHQHHHPAYAPPPPASTSQPAQENVYHNHNHDPRLASAAASGSASATTSDRVLHIDPSLEARGPGAFIVEDRNARSAISNSRDEQLAAAGTSTGSAGSTRRKRRKADAEEDSEAEVHAEIADTSFEERASGGSKRRRGDRGLRTSASGSGATTVSHSLDGQLAIS